MRAKRAEDTSNVESDNECSKRKRKATAKSSDSLNSDFSEFSGDDASDESIPDKRPKEMTSAPALPTPPKFSSSQSRLSRTITSSNSRSSSTTWSNMPCPSKSVTPKSFNAVRNSIQPNTLRTPIQSNTLPTPFLPDLGALDLTSEILCKNVPRTTPPARTSLSMKKDQQENFQRSVLTKLETVIQKQDEGLSMLRVLLGAAKVDGNDILEDLLPQPLDSVEDLSELNTRLGDEHYRRKMVNFLAAVCGHSLPESVRRMMAKLGTNNLWSGYSLKGRKGKSSFKDLAICKLVIRSCIRTHKEISEVDVEEQTAEVLKHAPHRSGGTKYKNCDDAA